MARYVEFDTDRVCHWWKFQIPDPRPREALYSDPLDHASEWLSHDDRKGFFSHLYERNNISMNPRWLFYISDPDVAFEFRIKFT